MKKLLMIVAILMLVTFGFAQNVTVNYVADNTTIFANPDRGWRNHAWPVFGPDAPSKGYILGPHEPFTVEELLNL